MKVIVFKNGLKHKGELVDSWTVIPERVDVRNVSIWFKNCEEKLKKYYEGKKDKDKHYWNNICKIQEAQTKKGLKKYGKVLEDNTELTIEQRIRHLQEELIDGLMYCEHLLDKLGAEK